MKNTKTAKFLISLLTAITTVSGLSVSVHADEDTSRFSSNPYWNEVPVRRMYNPNSGEHFYTVDTREQYSLCEAGWRDEGVAWYAPMTGDWVYRMYNPNAGDHFYTTDRHEAGVLEV